MQTDAAMRESRATGIADFALLAGLIVYGLLLIALPQSSSIGAAVAGMAGLASCIAAAIRPLPVRREQRPVLAWLGGALILASVATQLYFWPLHLLLPLALMLALAPIGGWLPELRRMCRLRPVSLEEWLWIAAVALVACAGINLWLAIAEPDLGNVRAMLPPLSGPALVAAGIGFALVNAVLEEMVWRGILLRWLSSWIGWTWAIALQAASFGLAHWNGVPSGWAGVLLAGGYGVVLGCLVRRSGTLLPAVAAHVIADLLIFAALVRQ